MKFFTKLILCSVIFLNSTLLHAKTGIIKSITKESIGSSVTVTGTLSLFASCTGSVSPAQSFTVSGSTLTANITITPPVGYEVSTSSTFISSVGTNASPLVLTQSGGTVTTTTVYARLANTASGTPSGNIACSSTGATTQNVAASGTVGAIITWTGTSGSNWNTSANWSGGVVPSASNCVVIPSVSNSPVITSASYSVLNLTVASGASLSISSGLTLTTLGDTITNYGIITGDGELVIAGTATTTKLLGNGLYRDVLLNSTADAQIGTAASDSLKILKLYSAITGAVVTTQGKMVLKSSDTLTASLVTPAGSNISGGLTVERYIPSNNRKKYVLVATPITSSTIYNSWQESGTATVGYGTQVTGPTGSVLATTGFDAVSNSGLASVFTYNDDNADGSKWVSVANTKTESNSYTKGYLLFVRGDRTITPGSSATGNTILRAKGSVIGSGYSPNLTSTGAGKFNLMGNAYACPLDWTKMDKTGLTNYFWVYDPNLGVFVNSDGTTVSPSTSKQQAKYIQSGQAFFIQNGASPVTAFNFTSSSKAPAANSAVNATVFDVKTPAKQLNVNVYSAGDNEFADGVVAVFGNEYKAGADAKDADKFANLEETFAFKRGVSKLSIDARPLVNGKDTLHFSMDNFAKKEYILKIDGNNLTEIKEAVLVDNYANAQQAIDLAGITSYKFTVSGDAASAGSERFMIVLGNTASVVAVDAVDNANLFVKLSPNPVRNQLQVNFKTAVVENTVINVINTLGQTVKTVNAGKVNAGNIKVDVSRLAAGNYTVQLLSGNNKVATQKIVKE